MKIYINKIIKRTELEKTYRYTTGNGKPYNQTIIYPFDEVIREEFCRTDFKAGLSLDSMLGEICDIYQVEWHQWSDCGALLFPDDIKYDTQIIELSDGRKMRFFAIQKEVEVA